MLKAYGAPRGGRVPDRTKPLYRIAHNVSIDLVSGGAVPGRAARAGRAERPGASRRGALIAALVSLPSGSAGCTSLRELHGLRIDETAAELSLTAAQVEQSLFAARNRLAEHLVFGDRLNCVAVQRLAAGPLDGDERRALNHFARAGCRSAGKRGRALSARVTSLEWLRGLVAGGVGGGALVAAKVRPRSPPFAAAAGVPVAVETSHYAHAHRARILSVPTWSRRGRHAPHPSCSRTHRNRRLALGRRLQPIFISGRARRDQDAEVEQHRGRHDDGERPLCQLPTLRTTTVVTRQALPSPRTTPARATAATNPRRSCRRASRARATGRVTRRAVGRVTTGRPRPCSRLPWSRRTSPSRASRAAANRAAGTLAAAAGGGP